MLAFGDERTDLGSRVGGVAHRRPLDPFQQPSPELLIDRLLDEDPACGGALLARGQEGAPVRGLDRALEVGIAHHNERVVATQLELDALAPSRRLPAHTVANRRRASEGNGHDVVV